MNPRTVKPLWQWWDALLQTGVLQPLQDGVVHYGYYRRPSAGKTQKARWVPIAIYPADKSDNPEIIVELDGKRTDKRPFDAIFSKGLQAISYETYVAVTRNGEPWPDAVPGLPDLERQPAGDWKEAPPQRLAERPNPDPQPPTDVPAADREVSRHDNDPPQDYRLLMEHQTQLVEEKLLVQRRLEKPINTQDEANSASEHANRIAALGKWFEAEYEQKNRPLLEQQKMLRTDY